MPGTGGTGSLAQSLCSEIETLQMGTCSPVSRHQLFVHQDIAYTSHNSAMCFETDINNLREASFIDFCSDFLKGHFVKGSDPGLCIAKPDNTLDRKKLVEFGLAAKKQLLSKSSAYCLAEHSGIHLSEHGGTGSGIIGAIAGIGLRLSGNDGRYRGWYHLGRPGEVISVRSICENDFVDYVTTREGIPLAPEENLEISSVRTKTIRFSGSRVILACLNENYAADSSARYRTMNKEEAKAY